MKIKSLIIVGLLGFSSACANHAEGFYISKFYGLGAGCDYQTSHETGVVGNGYLDVAAGKAQYFVGLKIVGADNITQEEVKVGNATLELKDRNRPIITQQVVNYRLSKRVGGTPKPYLTNLTVPFSDDGFLIGAFQVISPDLATQLFDGLAPSSGIAPSSVIEDFVDLSVDVEFKGEFSVSRSPFSTGVLTLPLRVYRSNPVACTSGFVPYFTDMTSGESDACRYVGQSFSQLFQPEPPSACCPGLGC